MSLNRRTLHGIAWAATSGWTQLGVSVCTFGIVAHRLSPRDIGAFGVVTLSIGLVEMVTGSALGESLQQRASVEQKHIDATFWVGLSLNLAAAAVIFCLSSIIMAPVDVAAGPLLAWAGLALPIGAATTVPNAMLLRGLRFGDIARVGSIASVLGGMVGIGAVLAGCGVWSFLLADFANRLCRMVGLWGLSGYRPGRPRQLGAIADLMRFNLHTTGTYLLGYLDRNVPRLLTGYLLGAAALGYLMIAQRVLDLLSQVVLSPLNSVTMVSVARLQADPAELRRFILSLYRLAAFFAYPAFLAAIILLPDLIRLIGHQWQPAILTTQILLLVGLRTTTGMFNIPLLRGVGHGGAALILLGAGFVLNLLLVSIGCQYATQGVAAAVLMRTLATWPLGCWLVYRATGISWRDQAVAGAGSLWAALIMAAGLAALLHALPLSPGLPRLVVGGLAGGMIYLGVIATFAHELRRSAIAALAGVFQGDEFRAPLRVLRNIYR